MHYQIGTENNQNTLFVIIIKCICGVTEILYSQKLLQLIIDLRNSSTEEKSFCTTIAYPDIRLEKQPQNVKDVEGTSLWKWYKREGNEFHLFLMSASLRPSLGVSTVRIIALNPFLSALCTNIAVKSRLLYTYIYQERDTKLNSDSPIGIRIIYYVANPKERSNIKELKEHKLTRAEESE